MNQRPPPPDAFEGGPEPVDGTIEDGPPVAPPPGFRPGSPFATPPPFGAPPQHPLHRTVHGQPGLHVVGGASGPVARAEVLSFVRQCHKGQKNRHTNEIEPWTTLVLVHLDSNRTILQWDVRPDEDDTDLAQEIDRAADAHGIPLARRLGTTQTYQLDCYFGGTTTPRANQIIEVDAPTGLHGAQNALLGRGGLANVARGQMSPQDHQTYRHNEALMQMSVGVTQWNMQSLQEQLQESRAETRYYREQIAAIELRERALKDAENNFKLQMYREQRSAQRKDWIIAKLAGYAPIFLAKLDAKISGMMQLTGDEKEQRALGMFKTLLGKLSDDNGGSNKLAEVATLLNLSDADLAQIMDFGKILWLEEQRENLHREAEKQARGGGFADLGKDVASIGQRLADPPKKG